jgi:predicted GTPase
MSRWRVFVVVGLILSPLLFFSGAGSYFLWVHGWSFLVWWPLALCMALGYILGWYWQSKHLLLHPPTTTPLHHWTERDKRAWQLVQAEAEKGASLPLDTLSDLDHYWTQAKELAAKIAALYHPGVDDPIVHLTVPEILSAIELAAHDLNDLVDRYVPGGHLLSLGDWQRARRAMDWYQPASNLYWAFAALFSPVETGTRYAASKLGLSQPWQMLQKNLLLWFYTAYLHRLGTYLIELNSGRLRIGATRYRELMTKADVPVSPAVDKSSQEPQSPKKDESPREVTIVVLGQVKAGKSSLINALIGEQRAFTDVLPATAGIQKYDLHPPNIPARLCVLDTIGYGHEGPKEDQLVVTQEAARKADLLLLVSHACNPARQADVKMLRELNEWFVSHPEVKRPPLLAVMTHIDLLSPALEWSPPYDWRHPTRRKEENIQQALTADWRDIGAFAAGVVPVCTASGKTYGIEEWLLPAIAEHLDEAQGVALLRCLRGEIDENKMRKVFHQLLASAKEAARIVLQILPRQPSPGSSA